MNIILKSNAEIEIMRRANMIVFEVHEELAKHVSPGISTAELDAIALEKCTSLGALPAFLNYPAPNPNVRPFPGVICASVNDAIVHGVPNKKKLESGDILSIDFGCCFDGFYGDSARTYAIGEVSEQAKKLMATTEASLELAIKQCLVGKRIGDISNAVQSCVEKEGYGVVREFVGHGIGRSMHEAPQVPNFGKPAQGRQLRAGMVLAIEPMVTAGSYETKILDDGWTAVTRDGSLAAHFEHTVAITDKGPYILSRP